MVLTHTHTLFLATWRVPQQAGQRPDPTVAMTFVRVDACRIVMYGGYNRNMRRRVNEVHILIIGVEIWVGV